MILQDTILVIDDDIDLQTVLKESLMSAGFEVETASNGREGLEKAIEIKPNLILLDLVMPIMDGWEFLEKIGDDKWGQNAKIIILTNADDIDSLSRAIEEKGFEYLVKTEWKIGDVVEKIRTTLGS